MCGARGLFDLAHETFCSAYPDAIAFPLETGRVEVVGNDVPQFRAREIGLIFCEIDLSKLNLRSRIRMVFGHLFPNVERGIGVAKGLKGFCQSHQRVAIVMLRIFRDDSFDQWASFSGFFLSKKTL